MFRFISGPEAEAFSIVFYTQRRKLQTHSRSSFETSLWGMAETRS